MQSLERGLREREGQMPADSQQGNGAFSPMARYTTKLNFVNILNEVSIGFFSIGFREQSC